MVLLTSEVTADVSRRRKPAVIISRRVAGRKLLRLATAVD